MPFDGEYEYLSGFGDYIRRNPWKPDANYLALDIERELDAVNPETGKRNELWIPFCIVEFRPRYQSNFGWTDAEIIEVYPVVELSSDPGDFHLPSIQGSNRPGSRGAEELVRIAQSQYNSRKNYYPDFVEYSRAKKPYSENYKKLVSRIWEICHEKAEQVIFDLFQPQFPGDEPGEINPFNPETDY